MSEYFISPDGKLYHSNGDYLQHWKYIKREKVNGKWRYYYHDDKYEAAKAKYENTKEKSSAKRQESDAIDKYATESGGVSDPYKSAAKKRASKKAERAEEKTAEAQEKYEAAKEKYEKSVGFKIADNLNKLSDGKKDRRKKEEEPKSNYVSASTDLEKAVKEYDDALRDYTRQADSIKYLANKYGADAVNKVETDKVNRMRSELKDSITKLAEARDKLKEEAEVYKTLSIIRKPTQSTNEN